MKLHTTYLTTEEVDMKIHEETISVHKFTAYLPTDCPASAELIFSHAFIIIKLTCGAWCSTTSRRSTWTIICSTLCRSTSPRFHLVLCSSIVQSRLNLNFYVQVGSQICQTLTIVSWVHISAYSAVVVHSGRVYDHASSIGPSLWSCKLHWPD